MIDDDFIKSKYYEMVNKNVIPKLIKKISSEPDRFLDYNSISYSDEIYQFLLTSTKIKIGIFHEFLLKYLFVSVGYKPLDNVILIDNKQIKIDQLLTKGDRVILIEQKMKDDHDSTKKTSIINDLKIKIDNIYKSCPTKKLTVYLYFVKTKRKNANYYLSEIAKLRAEYNININLCYGNSIFENEKEIGLLNYMNEFSNKKRNGNFEVNLDGENNEFSERTFHQIKDLSIQIWLNILNNKELVKEILPIIFPSKNVGGVLNLLFLYFKKKYKKDYDKISVRNINNYSLAAEKIENLIEELDKQN